MREAITITEDVLEYAAEFAKKSEKEICELKKRQCMKCFYYSVVTGKTNPNGTCDYIAETGMVSGCNPFDCVKEGKYRPQKTGKKKRGVCF